MDEVIETEVDWRDLAAAVPGAVGIRVEDRFDYASAEFAEIVGTTTEALVGTRWQTVIDAGDVPRLERKLDATVEGDGEWTGPARTNGPGIDEVPVDLTVSAAGADVQVWVFEKRDGREPASAEADSPAGRSVRERPDFVRQILDAVDDVVYVLDEDGESVLWNRTLVETTGYSHARIDGMDPTELIPEDQHDRVPGLLKAISDAGDRRVEVDIRTSDGERIPHEFRGTTFEDPETGRVYRCGVGRDVSERIERERELERYETIVETVDDGVYALDEDLRFTFANDALCELTELSREDLLGTSVAELFQDADELATARAVREQAVAADDVDTGRLEGTLPTSTGERHLESQFRLRPEPDDEFAGSVGVLRDVTERKRRERTLERQRDELATLDRINELLLETVRELVQTSSRDAVERRICDRLVASDLYRFAWVGERAFDGDEIVPRTSAGEGDGYLDAITVTSDDTVTGDGPAGRAMRTGDVQVASVDDPSFEPWHDAARERGFRSVAAVPLRHGESVFGVLLVYAGREAAFSPRELAGFGVLGRTVGFVVHAARNRDLLFADAVVELEFRISEGDAVLVPAAADHGCELTFDGYVASGDRWILYLGVDGARPDAVAESVADDAPVDAARVVRRGEDGGRIELILREGSLLHTVGAAGATVREATADPDGVSLVLEAPADADARSVVDVVQDGYPSAEFLARRERDREVATLGRPGGVLAGLTDRQRETLEAAYRAGYFTWPRESTAEDVAESLDLSSPTLHGHLRKAENRILSALFDVA